MHPLPRCVLTASVLLASCSASDDAASGDADPSAADASSAALDAATPSSTCGTPATLTRIEFEHEGRQRSAEVHLPADYDGTARPLVLNFHGRESTVAQQRTISLMDASADAHGFVAVYPEGVAKTFNAGFCCGEAQSQNVDDVGFALALLDHVEAKLCIDKERIFATGLSNGGYMAQRLACEAPERFRGFSSVAGLLALTSCSPSTRRPILHFHGTADSIVPYDGNAFLQSAPETMADWATRNGCDTATESVYQEGDASCVRYRGCSAGNDVELCTIAQGGHTWPGGTPVPVLGATSTDISANDYMWSFWNK